MHLNSKLLFESYAMDHIKENLKILEIGPSGYPSSYFKLLKNQNSSWHTLDIDTKHTGNANANPNHTISPDPYSYPLENNSFDIIIAGQVMEHVSNIWKWVKELKRLLVNGGKIIIICPISWPYHEAPIDCWRIYPEGMKGIAEELELIIIENLFESLEKKLIPDTSPTFPYISLFDEHGHLPYVQKKKYF